MGFFSSLLGGRKKAFFQDADLGQLSELKRRGENIIWQGQIKFLHETISLFISGSDGQLNAPEKMSLLETLKNETIIDLAVNEALRAACQNAAIKYANWRAHFNCIAISTLNNEITINFEEKESLYHFNVSFLNGKPVGVSIDS